MFARSALTTCRKLMTITPSSSMTTRSYHMMIPTLNEVEQKFDVVLMLKEKKEKQKLKELEKKLQREHALKMKEEKKKSRERMLAVKEKQAEKLKEKSKRKRDENAPKRAMTPLFWFNSQNFTKVQAELTQNGTLTANTQEKFKLIQAEVKKRWDELSESERNKYIDLAAQDKLRYQKEAKAYQKKKDANKRPISGYLRFFAEIRADLIKENPTAKVTELSKLAGARWNALSDAQKKPYQQAYQQAKAEYDAKRED